jgi:tryptophan synthase alpha subunit
MVEGGADIVEIGVPFSDPLADGATIQKAAYEALENGVTPLDCIEFVRQARARHPETGLLFMTYMNLVLAYGTEAFARDSAAAGLDGMILVDLPADEADEAQATLARHGLDLVELAAPTSPEERLRLIADHASGFVYCVSVAGTTGASEGIPPDLPAFLARVRRCTSLPLAVGFGMSRRDQVEALTGIADGVVVGSALVNLMGTTERQERAKAVREFVEVLSGRRSS